MYRQPSVEVATLVEADDLFRRAAVYDPVGIASIAAWSDSSLAQSTRPLGAGIIAANWLSTAFSTARLRVSPFCLASFRILSSTRLGPDQNSHSWYQLGGKGGVDHEEPMLVVADDL